MAGAVGRVPVFLNVHAGLARTDAVALAQQLGADRVDVEPVPPESIAERVRAAAAAGAPVVGVAGGDGTQRTAAAALVDTDTALLCVPTGTLNNFGRRLGIHSVSDAAAALRAGRVARLSLGGITSADGEDTFLNTVTFGEYSRIVRIRERHRERLGKWPAAVFAFFVVLFTLRRMTLDLRDDGVTLTRRTPFVWTGLGRGSFPLVHESTERRSSPDLEIAVLRSTGAFAALGFVLRVGVRMLARRHGPVDDALLDKLHTRRLTVSAGHTLDATADGEVLRLQPPVVLSVRDRALRVVTGSNRND